MSCTSLKTVSVFLLFALTVRGQQLQEKTAGIVKIRSIDPSDTDYRDLEGLKTAIGNARIVLLGEQTHGEGSTFLAKTRLIKFLHERAGFEVLAFESGFYDCARIWENVRNGRALSEEVIGSLFYMYATSKQVLPLFDYIQTHLSDSHALIVTGFESQHTGIKAKTSLFDDFQRFLQQRDPAVIDSAWRLFHRVSVAMFASRDYRPEEQEKQVFFREVAALKETLAAGNTRVDPGLRTADQHTKDQHAFGSTGVDSLTGSTGFWYHIVCSIESQALRYWQLVKGNEVSVRDRQMAENLIWLAEKAYPGKKIIVWAHNGHIAKSLTSLGPVTEQPASSPAPAPAPADTANAFVPMGVTIHRYFGKQAYHIGFSGAGGSYMDYVDSHIVPVPPKPVANIEGKLTAGGAPYVFIDYHHSAPIYRQKQTASLADYGDLSGIWPEVFDGLFVIKEIFPAVRTGR